MSKSTVFENCLIEPPEICPHNKIVQTIGLKYRTEIPVRLTKITHLRKLGGRNNGSRSRPSSDFVHSENIQQHERVVGGDEEVHRNDSIFSCRITSFEPSTDPIRRKEGRKNSGRSNACQTTSLLYKICRGCKRSKNYFTNRGCFTNKKESTSWIMKPERVLRKTSSENLDLKGNFENPIDVPKVKAKQVLNKTLIKTDKNISEFPYLTKTLTNSRYLHSNENVDSKASHPTIHRSSTDRCYQEDLKYLKTRKLLKQRQKMMMRSFQKDKAIMEYFNAEQNLEDMQYKCPNKTKRRDTTQISDTSKTKQPMQSVYIKSIENNVVLIPSQLDFLEKINECSFHDKVTKDLLNSNRRKSMEITISDTSENLAVQNEGVSFICPKKKLHPKRYNKHSISSKRKYKRHDFKTDQKNIKKPPQSSKNVQTTSKLKDTKQNFESQEKTESGKEARDPQKDIKNVETTHKAKDKPNKNSKSIKKNKIIEPDPNKIHSILPATISDRFNQNPNKLWNLHQLPWNNSRIHKPQAGQNFVTKPFISSTKTLNLFNDFQIRNENYDVKKTKASPKLDLRKFKGDFFLNKPNSIPIYCQCPLRPDKIMLSHRGGLFRTTCTLSGSERILFEKNHF